MSIAILDPAPQVLQFLVWEKKNKQQSADDLPYFIGMKTSWKDAHIPETEEVTPNSIDETL